MLKTLKYLGISVAVILVLLIVLAIALPYVLPLNKIKDMAAEKISETIHREVKLGEISFNLFSGIKLSDLYIGNRKGFSKKPFISAEAIEFRYSFLKLITGKIAVTKAVLIKPEILIEKKADGTSNYGDLTGKPKTKKVAEEGTKKKEPMAILVSRFAISKGRLTLVTYDPEGKKVNELKDLNIDISNISLKTEAPINIAISVLGVYEGKSVPIKLGGKVYLDLGKSYINLQDFVISAAGEKLKINAKVSNFNSAPNIKASLSSGGIDLDKFMAVLSGSKKKKVGEKVKAPYGQLTRKINRSLRSISPKMVFEGSIDLKNITFRAMKLDSLKISSSLKKKIVWLNIEELKAYNGKLSGSITANLNVSGLGYSVKNLNLAEFKAAPFSNAAVESFLTGMKDYADLKDKIEGSLSMSVSLTGRGVETPDILANLKANGNFLLKDGKIKKMKSLQAVGQALGIDTFKHDIEIQEFKADFSAADKVATISDLIVHNGKMGDVEIKFNGKANMGTMKFIKGNVLELRLNPVIAKDLPAEYDVFVDKDGWASLEFELTGSLKKPIPIPKLGKPVQKIIDKEKERVQKEAEEQLKKQLEDKAKELFKF
ncbi:AsmA family protein [Candidatus Margulisiibacteriota bacterium]